MDPKPGPSRLGPLELASSSLTSIGAPRRLRRSSPSSSTSQSLPSLTSLTLPAVSTLCSPSTTLASSFASSSSTSPSRLPRGRKRPRTDKIARFLYSATTTLAVSASLTASVAAAPSRDQYHQQPERWRSSSYNRDASAVPSVAISSYKGKEKADRGEFDLSLADSQSLSNLDDHDDNDPSQIVRRYVQAAVGEDAHIGRVPSPHPSMTHPHHSLHGPPSKRQASVAAYSSGIIADWTHQSRSVWFQRKAIIIISCFLAIFIVLTIGAAVFLRDRSADDLDEDADDVSDEAALKRMREERRMRSGTRKKKGSLDAEKRADASNGDTVDQVGPPTKRKGKGRKRSDKEGSSSGSSTAVSKRLVSRWIRAPSAPHGSLTPDSGAGADDSASIRSSASRRSRLGGPRSERVEVAYHSRSSADNDDPAGPLARQVSSSSNSRQSVIRTDSRTPSSSDRPSSSGGPSRLDASDLRAVEQAGTQQQDALPPAYIPTSATLTGAATSSSSPPPPVDRPHNNFSTVQAGYQRPLAGEGAVDSKGGRGLVETALPHFIPRPSDLHDNVFDGLGGEDDSGHIATDDKSRLAALAAAASAPAVEAPSAPQYGDDNAGSGRLSAAGDAIAAPSAPAVDVDEEGFERMIPAEEGVPASTSRAVNSPFDGSRPSAVASSSVPVYQGSYIPLRDNKGKGRASESTESGRSLTAEEVLSDKSGILPRPPAPHRQAFSPFDRPYHQSPFVRAPSHSQDDIRQRSTSRASNRRSEESASPARDAATNGPATQRRLEKQREAEGELALMASSPADRLREQELLPAYEGSQSGQVIAVASAPDVDDLLSGPPEDGGREATPSAKQDHESESQPSAPDLSSTMPLTSNGDAPAPSAPACDDGDDP